MKLSFLSSLLSALLATNLSCQVVTSRPEIDVSIENKSSRTIENARARFGDFRCSWGTVSGGAMKIYGRYPHPITPDAELHWEVEGQPKMQKFDLRKLYPPGRSGRLSFVIIDDRAELYFRESPHPK